MDISLTPTQSIWIRRIPLLSILFGIFVLPIILLLWYEQYDPALGILACYGMVALTWAIPVSVNLFENSNKLSTKKKAILQQQADDADEWGLIYKQYCKDIGQPQRPQPKPYQQQQQDDTSWKRAYEQY